MRVMPVSVRGYRAFQPQKNQNTNNQIKQNNISFGNFESPDIEDDLENAVGKPLCDLDKIDIMDLKKSPFITVRKGHDKQGNTMLYAVMNKDVTDKHENKKFFDEMLEECKELVEIGALSYLDIIEAGIPEKEPYFMGPIADSEDLGRLCADIHKAETGYVYTPSKSSSYTPPQEDDPWLEAVLREIHS